MAGSGRDLANESWAGLRRADGREADRHCRLDRAEELGVIAEDVQNRTLSHP